MEVNKSHLISSALGFLMGSSITFGGISYLEKPTTTNSQDSSDITPPHLSPYELTPEDPYGDVVITSGGKKYHYQFCRNTKRADEKKCVNSEDAKKNGYTPCKVCFER